MTRPWASRDFFGSADWFTCLSRAGFTERPIPRVYLRRSNDDPAQAPHCQFLREDRSNRRLLSLTNHYSVVYHGIEGNEPLPASELTALVRLIAGESPAWTEIELRYLRGDCPLTGQLLRAFDESGFYTVVNHHRWNWYLRVDGRDFGAYMQSRPGRLRNTVARRTRQATRLHALRYRLVSQQSDLQWGLEDYLRIYARSWKPEEASPRFVPEFMDLCVRLGILRLGLLYLDDQPVAAQFWIVAGGKAWIYKLAQDPRADDLSVGTLLTAWMFAQAIDVDRVREVDFGVGDEAYKRDWMEQRRQLVTLQAVNPRTIRGAALAARLAARSGLRRLGLRRYTPVRPAGLGPD